MKEFPAKSNVGNDATVLELRREDLRDSALKKQLLKFSDQKKNVDVKLTDFDFHSIQDVISTLERLSLRSLDLSNCRITRDEFVLFMKQFTNKRISCLIFKDNHIECHDEKQWRETFLNKYHNLPNLKVIQLGGNLIYNHNDSLIVKAGGKSSRESYFAALNSLLSVTGFTFSQFKNSKFKGISHNEHDELVLNVMLDSKLYEFPLRADQYEDLERVRASIRKPLCADVFSLLQLGIEDMCLSSGGFDGEVIYRDLDSLNKEKALTLSFEHHPDAPLVCMLRRNSLYDFEAPSTCQSLLYAEPLSVEQGYIYFLAHNEGKHAALVFECLTPDGQRVFECAHLTATVNGLIPGLFGQSDMQISYMKIESIGEFLPYLMANYSIAKVKANYQQCRALWSEIDHEVINGVDNAKYSKIIFSSSNSADSEGRIMINCVRWALDKIKKYTQQDLSSFGASSSFIPLRTLSEIVTKPQYRPGTPRILEQSTFVGISIQESSDAAQQQSPTSSVKRGSSFWDAGNFNLGLFGRNTNNGSPAVAPVKENFDELKCLIGQANSSKKSQKGKVIKFSFSQDRVSHVKAVVESLRSASIQIFTTETPKGIRLSLNFSDFEKLYPEKKQQTAALRCKGGR